MIPTVSVVIPTFRRVGLLSRCLDALLVQTLPPERYEIVVVDDGRTADTREAVEACASRAAARGTTVIYLQSTPGSRGPAAARNRGWLFARGRIIAFTDDDTIPAANWLAEGLRALDSGADAACGRVRVPVPPKPTDYERNVSHLETALFVTANCFIRRRTLLDIGGFDERFKRAWREDSDIHFKLLERGATVARAPAAVVIHPVRPARWGVSVALHSNLVFDALLYKKHPGLYRRFIRAMPPLNHYATCAAALAGAAGFAGGSPLLGTSGVVAWLALTVAFCLRRLRGTTRTARHVLEMIATSIVIPPVAIYYRVAGAVRYRVLFA